jgi:hypothetical protein
MFNNRHFDRVRQAFADQFEPDGAGFLYRKSMKAAPIRVTETERDNFLTTFNRRLRYANWAIVFGTVFLIGLLALLVRDVDSTAGQLGLWAGLGLILGFFLLIYSWAWGGPARDLERRPVVGLARTREELQQIKFAKITYKQLALAPVIAVLLLFKVSAKNDVLHGWGMLWLIFAVS